ncbi:uncharacterized protein LOC120946210 [Rana temporaria]|uniref:uncharacterized protein LOC120937053 n=1 Tax=Rana temporaria TaxID=8407 RepID=UPI001AAC4759|nr:uncharacterized protein LOC120937053 [Rana temporaria]XP_040208897.1 uncharacterized protein LOC120940241 [Rana temporaria]XP_040216964.1 uncharacterized protein LOC120946210 [Rana temporaria]
MLLFLKNVMDVNSTASNISGSEEEVDSDAEDTIQEAAGDMPLSEANPSPEVNTNPATENTPRVPIRSVQTSRSKRHPKKKDMDAAMLTFMEDMRAMRKDVPERKDPFLDPTHVNANFLRNSLFFLDQVPDERKIEVHLAIGNFTGACVQAALAGEPMPVFTRQQQRPYQPEQTPQLHTYQQPFSSHHPRAPATTTQNLLPLLREPTNDSSTSQPTTSQPFTPYPYSPSPRPFYHQLP